MKAKVKQKESKITKRVKRISSVFLAPSLLGTALFFFVPFLVVVYYSLIDSPVAKEFVGMDNYVNVIHNKAFILAVTNTLKFSAVSVPLVVILSLWVAFALSKNIPSRSKIRSALLSPMMVPIASIILIWQVLFHYNGVVNEAFSVWGLDKIDWFKSEYAPVVIVILFVWKNLGYNMILFMAAIAAIPKELLEVAKLESAGEFKIFWSIKIRYLASSILFVTILSIINSFKVFREIYLLTGDYPYDSLYMLQHYMNNMFKSLDYQKLSAAAIIMAAVMIVLVMLMFMVEEYVGKDIDE